MKAIKGFSFVLVLIIVLTFAATSVASSQNQCATHWCGANNPPGTGMAFRYGNTGIGTSIPSALLDVQKLEPPVPFTLLGTSRSPREPVARLSSTALQVESGLGRMAVADLQFSATASTLRSAVNPSGSDVMSTASIGVSASSSASSRTGGKLFVLDAENQDMPISFRIGGREQMRIHPDGTIEINRGGIRFADGSTQSTATLRGVRGLKGDKGDKGAKGDRGDRGVPGRDGRNGRDGTAGTVAVCSTNWVSCEKVTGVDAPCWVSSDTGSCSMEVSGTCNVCIVR